jgi:phosphate uptake regulator
MKSHESGFNYANLNDEQIKALTEVLESLNQLWKAMKQPEPTIKLAIGQSRKNVIELLIQDAGLADDDIEELYESIEHEGITLCAFYDLYAVDTDELSVLVDIVDKKVAAFERVYQHPTIPNAQRW